MNIRFIILGLLFGLFVSVVVFCGPLYPHSLPDRIWRVEEKGFTWVDSALKDFPRTIHNVGMLAAGLFHLVFWALFGGLIFWAVAFLFSKLKSDE